MENKMMGVYYISDRYRIKRGERVVARGTKHQILRGIWIAQVKWLGIWLNKYWLWDDLYNTLPKYVDHFVWKYNRNHKKKLNQ